MRWIPPPKRSSMPSWRCRRAASGRTPRSRDQVDRALLQDPGADRLLDLVAGPHVDRRPTRCRAVQQVRQHQPGRSGADDRDLGAGGDGRGGHARHCRFAARRRPRRPSVQWKRLRSGRASHHRGDQGVARRAGPEPDGQACCAVGQRCQRRPLLEQPDGLEPERREGRQRTAEPGADQGAPTTGAPASTTAAATAPRTSEPRTLTVNVPHGKRVSCRDWTKRSMR